MTSVIVVGASVAGLLAARALADHVDHVVVWAEAAAMPGSDTVWLAPLPRVRSDLNRAGLRVRWCTETSRAHRVTVDALVAAYTSAAAELRGAGAGPAVDDHVASHRLWSRWLREGRVRKFAVVAEKVRPWGGGRAAGPLRRE